MDILQFYQDHNITYQTENHKHCRPGWVNVSCPFCTGNPGLHLGFELETNHFVCYRCGFHPIVKTLSALTNLPERDIRKRLPRYDLFVSTKETKVIIRKKAFQFPSNTEPLTDKHKRYLEKRGFDPVQLEYDWGLKGTGPIARLEHSEYKHRIIIPIYWGGQIVSFDSRDITGNTDQRYKACPLERELIPHKEIIYGKQSKWGETGLCVEGYTDVWRFGFNAFSVSGIKFTPKQVRVISKTFKRVPVIFDDDPQAVVQANKLVSALKFRGVDSFTVQIKGDPGGMPKSEADYLVKQLI